MGSRLGAVISGGGTLRPETARLFAGTGVPVLEGYGLTEAPTVVAANPSGDVRVGTVGPPLRGIDIAVDTSRAPGSAFDGECLGESHYSPEPVSSCAPIRKVTVVSSACAIRTGLSSPRASPTATNDRTGWSNRLTSP